MNRRIPFYSFLIAILITSGNAALAQTAGFYATPSSGCAPLAVSFTDTSSGATSYSWNLGNSNSSILQNPSTTYSNPGTYTVTLSINGGASTATSTIIVYDKPAVSITAASTAGCTPHTTQFSATVTANSPGPLTYAWDFGDGNTSSSTSPTHTYTAPGTYTVSLTVTNGAGCSRTVVQSALITSYPLPAAAFTANQLTFCTVPSTVNFTNTSTGGTTPYTSAWNFGDAGTGTGNTTSHTYTTGGNFTVTNIVTDARGCKDTASYVAYITVVSGTATFSGPSATCEDAQVSFSNTSSGGSNTTWTSGDGFTGSGSTFDHIYANPGTYTVTMNTDIGSCPKTATKSITVNAKPVMAFTQSPSIPCPAPVTVAWNFTGSGATTYQWRWDSGGLATGPSASKLFNKNINDRITLIATSTAGCTDSLSTDTVYIRDIITRINHPLNITEGCRPLLASFIADVRGSWPPWMIDPPPYPVPATSWRWHFAKLGSPTLWHLGDSSMASSPTYIFPDSGDYRVRVIITTQNGCLDTAYHSVHVDTKVPPSFTASPLRVCPKGVVTFVNTTNHLPGVKYFWELENVTSFTKLNDSGFTYKFLIPDTVTVKIRSNHNGCFDTFSRQDYIIVDPSNAAFKDSILCPPSRTVFFLNSSKGATSTLWDFGDGNTSTAAGSPTYTYATTGTYNVRLTTENSVFGCKDTMTRQIKIYSSTLSFTSSATGICPLDRATFSATTSIPIVRDGGGSIIFPKFSWRIDTARTLFDPLFKTYSYQFLNKGPHTVVLYTMNENGCIDSLVKTNHVLVSQPIVRFSAKPPIGCQPLPVLFTDTSIHVPGAFSDKRVWEFGDGDTAHRTVATINHTYNAVGNYQVKLIVTDNQGCKDSVYITNAVVVRKPVASFLADDTSACARQPIAFVSYSTGATTPLRHLWHFGDGDSSFAVQPIHQYKTPGLYAVRLIVTDSTGCSDTLLRLKYIHVYAPTAAFSMSSRLAICPPLQVNFTNASIGAVSYEWTFGTGGGPVTVTNPVSTFSTPGQYIVTLVATDVHTCTDTARDTVRVLGYNGAFNYTPTSGCLPLTVTFTPPAPGIPSITWDFSDGVIVVTNGTGATHTYTRPGSYLPKAIFSDGLACTAISEGLIPILVDELKADFSHTVPCAGAPFSLTQTASALFAAPSSFLWAFSTTDSARGATVSYTFATPGNHPVTLIASNAAGCSDTITKQVYINPLPLVNATDDTAICPGDTALLRASGARSYVWSSAAGAPFSCSACDSTLVYPGGPALYYLTGTDTNNCVNKDSTRVIIQIKTTSSTGPGGEICVGESFRLTASGAMSYEWLPAATIDSPFIASPLATPQSTTTYIVAAREGTCLIDSQRVTVVVRDRPIFSAGPDEVITVGSAVALHASGSSIVRIEWTPDTTLSCLDCFRPNASPVSTTNYYATGYNEWGCATTDTVTVRVRCNGALVFIPNTFTPNGDGLNEYFYPRGEGVERMTSFRVYNRWGELLFERSNVVLNDERSGWNGTFKGKALPPDTYVYTMMSRCDNGEVINWKGDITIMR